MADQNFRVKRGLEVGLGSTVLYASPTGQVGIAKTNPTSKLEVNVGTATSAFDVEGSAGKLFSIKNNLTSGSIFSVNDVSGIPSIDVNADGTIQLAPFGVTEKIGVGVTNPTQKLDVNGGIRLRGALYDFNNAAGSSNQILSSTGAGVSWTTLATASPGLEIFTSQASTPYYVTATSSTSGISTAGFIDSGIVIRDSKFGVGTNNPTGKVEIKDSFITNDRLLYLNSSSGFGTGFTGPVYGLYADIFSNNNANEVYGGYFKSYGGLVMIHMEFMDKLLLLVAP